MAPSTQISEGLDQSPGQSKERGEQIEYTEAEEKAAVRRADLIVIPMLSAIYFIFQLDRINIGNALTDNFLDDVGITQSWFNVGQQLLAAGLTVVEIPSNMVLYRVGPQLWISCQIILWGLVATFQAFQHGVGGYLSTRLLLGLLEAGYMPAGLYMLSQWYKSSELSSRYALFSVGYILGQGTSGLVAYGILQMRGVSGLAGWQWLFLIEGMITVCMGILFACFFPGTPSKHGTMVGLKFFTDNELAILRERVRREHPERADSHQGRIGARFVYETLKDTKVWLHVLASFCGAIPSAGLNAYTPTLIASFGYGALKANAMTSVPHWISLVLTLSTGFLADRIGRRGVFVLLGVTVQLTFAVSFKCIPDDAAAGTKFILLIMILANFLWWHSINASWLSMNAKSPEERSVTLALLTMATNVSLVPAAQIFRSDDLPYPYYHRARSVLVAVLAAGVVIALVLLVVRSFSSKKRGRRLIEYRDKDIHDSKGRDTASPAAEDANWEKASGQEAG